MTEEHRQALGHALEHSGVEGVPAQQGLRAGSLRETTHVHGPFDDLPRSPQGVASGRRPPDWLDPEVHV